MNTKRFEIGGKKRPAFSKLRPETQALWSDDLAMKRITEEGEPPLKPSLAIVAESSDPGIDLVVTSTHGRSGFRRASIGSIAEHVARYANCPVMTVPSRGCP